MTGFQLSLTRIDPFFARKTGPVMYRPTSNQTPESVAVGRQASTPSDTLVSVSDLSQEAPVVPKTANSGPGKAPMQTAPWTCQNCSHENPGRSIQCEACHGTLPVITLFKARRIYSLSRDYIRLTWEVHDAHKVVMIPGHEQLPLKGFVDIDLDVGAEYQLVATNDIGTKSLTTKAKALPPRIKSFSAVDPEIQIGYPIILRWEVENAAHMEIDHGVGEVSGQSYVELMIEEPGTITLKTSNEAGESTATVKVGLKEPVINAFYPLTDQIELGVPNTLCWEVSNAAELIIKGSNGDIIELNRDQHQCDILTDRNTTYTLMARNAVGYVKDSLDLFLPAPVIRYFEGDSNVSTEGSLVTLSWEVDHAFTARLEPGLGEVPLSGSIKVRPNGAYTVYTLHVLGHSGESEQSFRVDKFPVPLEESLLLLHEPNLNDVMLGKSTSPDINQEGLSPEEIERQRDYQIWRAQQMMLTDEMLRMEKASIRREFNRIVKKLKNNLG